MRLRSSRSDTRGQGKEDYTQRFSERATDYARYRPRYPPAMIERLEGEIGLEKSWKIADIGSGTGILSELFLRNGNVVFCVEPNGQMRSMAEARLGGLPGFVSVMGRAEATTLPSHCVDLVVVGQALHWFDVPKARTEFKRILKNPDNICIVFNNRRKSRPAERAYSDLIRKYTGAEAKKVPGFEDSVARFFGSHRPKKIVMSNSQTLTARGVIGRLASSSYMPQRGSGRWKSLERDARKLVDEHGGRVTIHYYTEAYLPSGRKTIGESETPARTKTRPSMTRGRSATSS